MTIQTIDLIEPWIWSTLTGDSSTSDAASLRSLLGPGWLDHISGTLSATELPTPYVTFLMQSTRDVLGVGGTIIDTDSLYIAKAVAAGSTWNTVRPLADRLDHLLHRPGQVISLAEGRSVSIVRDRIVQYPEVDEGVQYRHLGAIYRVRAN